LKQIIIVGLLLLGFGGCKSVTIPDSLSEYIPGSGSGGTPVSSSSSQSSSDEDIKPEKGESVELGVEYKTVLLGTYSWDVDTNSLGVDDGSDDIQLGHDDSTHFRIYATDKSVFAQAKNISYADIDKDYVKNAKLSLATLNQDDLVVGAIVVFKTNSEHYGKFIIEGFSSSHDFDSPEGQKYLRESWKEYSLKKPAIERYNMHLKWMLFK